MSDAMASILAEEIADHPPLQLVLRPETAFTLVGILQLAKRHPGLPPNTREIVDTFLNAAREYFADCPFILEAIRMGDDPTFDEHERGHQP